VVTMKNISFMDVTPFDPLDSCEYFGETPKEKVVTGRSTGVFRQSSSVATQIRPIALSHHPVSQK
jgi:hypothetical protein